MDRNLSLDDRKLQVIFLDDVQFCVLDWSATSAYSMTLMVLVFLPTLATVTNTGYKIISAMRNKDQVGYFLIFSFIAVIVRLPDYTGVRLPRKSNLSVVFSNFQGKQLSTKLVSICSSIILLMITLPLRKSYETYEK